jgi:hypothetical protein
MPSRLPLIVSHARTAKSHFELSVVRVRRPYSPVNVWSVEIDADFSGNAKVGVVAACHGKPILCKP